MGVIHRVVRRRNQINNRPILADFSFILAKNRLRRRLGATAQKGGVDAVFGTAMMKLSLVLYI